MLPIDDKVVRVTKVFLPWSGDAPSEVRVKLMQRALNPASVAVCVFLRFSETALDFRRLLSVLFQFENFFDVVVGVRGEIRAIPVLEV